MHIPPYRLHRAQRGLFVLIALKRCRVCSSLVKGETQFMVELENPPLVSAETAAIAAQ